jgi:uncharacterized RDD family membrane protein YckC
MSPDLEILTPEGVTFSYRLAGPVARFMAWGVDLLCIMMLWIVLGWGMSAIAALHRDIAQAITLLGYFAILIGYGMVLEWFWRGQTVGKRFMKLRVIDGQGLRLQPQQIVVRNLLRTVDMLPFAYLVGGLSCFLSPRSQRLGDFAAGTVVVRIPTVVEPDLEQLALGRFNSLRRFPHLEGRLRQRLSPREAMVALQAIVRRDELEPDRRVELFAELADRMKAVVVFPAEVVETMTDEQYIRNVVDILFRPRGQMGPS